MKRILVLNMGLKSIRSIVFGVNGQKISSASRPLETHLNDERVIQNPSEWWEKAKIVIEESVQGTCISEIEYITVTASSACLVCVDQECNELDSCIMVSDKRATQEAIDIENEKAFLDVREQTGLNSNAYMMIPKILWVKRNQPELFSKTYKFLTPNDYLIAKMTGVYVTDCFNAQKYHYNIKTEKYPISLLNSLNIPGSTFPLVLRPGESAGFLTKKAATYLGLSTKTEVIVTTYDAICSFFGSGVSEEGDACDVSGTVTAFRALTYKKNLIPSNNIFIMPFKEGDISIVGGSNNLGGGLIEWLKQCYYMNDQLPYEMMESDADRSRAGADGLLFLPYLLGERAPIWDNTVRGVFFGLERTHTRRDMTRAVFESTGFIDLDFIRSIEKTGVQINRIILSGGLARINLISQIKADITGKEILVLSDFETTAIGAAMLALTGKGVFLNLKDALDHFVFIRMRIKPNIKQHEFYTKMYKLFKFTYKSLREPYKMRQELLRQLIAKREIEIENL